MRRTTVFSLLIALLLAAAACRSRQSRPAPAGPVQSYGGGDPEVAVPLDPSQIPLEEEIGKLPFKQKLWDYRIPGERIARVTLQSDHLFVETESLKLYAVDRRSGRISWVHMIDTNTPLDYPPVIAQGVPEEIARLTKDLQDVSAQVEAMKDKKDVDREALKKIRQKRKDVAEQLRISHDNDNVYAITRDTLFCIDRGGGALLWRRRLPFVSGTAPFAIRTNVFVPSVDRERVWKLDVAKQGDDIDFYRAGGQVFGAPVYESPSLYFTSGDGKAYCYNVDTSRLSWSYETEGEIRAGPAVYKLRIWVPEQKRDLDIKYCFVGGTDMAFYAINADSGLIEWKYEAGARFLEPAIASGETVYARAENIGLLALNIHPVHRDDKGKALGSVRSGELRWKVPLAERFLVRGEQRVYILGPAATIYAMDEKSGEIRGQHKIREFRYILTNTMDDVLYLATDDGWLYALKESKTRY